jgi:hypothetical protein
MSKVFQVSMTAPYMMDKRLTYYLEGHDAILLEKIMSRLFCDTPLDGDDKRDLANIMWVVMDRVEDAVVEYPHEKEAGSELHPGK